MRIRTFPVAALSLWLGAAQAGSVLKTTDKDLANNRETVTTVYAQDGKMRVQTSAAQDGFAIFKDDVLYSINPRERSYVAMDRASMKKMAEQINPALKQMQEQMAKMSPEQRAQMERMMGGNKMPGMGKPSTEEFRKTSRTGKVAGYSCTYTEVVLDGAVVSELCVTPLTSLKGGQDLYDASIKLSALMEDMMKEIDAPWLEQMVNRQVENYGKLGGVPIITRTMSGGKAVREATLQSITSESVPAALFEVPADYTKKDMMQNARR